MLPVRPLKNRLVRRTSANAKRRPPFALGLERLEDRVVPSLTVIPMPVPTNESVVNAWVNSQGQVAGTAGGNGFVWTQAQGTRTVFAPTEAFLGNGALFGENDTGQILGTNSGELMVWDATSGVTPVPLPQPAAGSPLPTVVGAWINNQGQVAGTTSVSQSGNKTTSGFVWSASLATQAIFKGGSVLGENNSGQVLGETSKGSLEIWTPSGTTAVPLPSGDTSVVSASINDKGQVVGTANGGGFVWTKAGGAQAIFVGGSVMGQDNAGQVLGVGTDLLDLWDPTTSVASAVPLPAGTVGVPNASINAQGQVAGTASVSASSQTGTTGFVWSKALGLQTIFPGGSVLGEGNGGAVIGTGSDPLDLWNPASPSSPPISIPLPMNIAQSQLFINNQGQVAGTAYSEGNAFSQRTGSGFVWTAALGTRTIFPGGYVLAENNTGQVLGVAGDGSLDVLNPDGTMTQVPLPSGSTVEQAFLNDQGQVAGTVFSSGGTTGGFVWSPSLGLKTLPNADVLAENNPGQVLTETAAAASQFGLAVWDPKSGMVSIPLPKGTTYATAALNDQGQVAGEADASTGIGEMPKISGFIWTAPESTVRSFPTGFLGENNVGEVLTQSASGALELRNSQGGIVATIPLPPKTDYAVATVNDEGQVAGTAPPLSPAEPNDGQTNGFVWNQGPGTVTIFPHGGMVLAQNNAGQVLGLAADGTLEIWTGSSGPGNRPNTITFNKLNPSTFGSGPITLTATASSGLPVSYSVVSGPATVAGNTLTITGVGTVTIQATQPGNGTYVAASPVDETLAVNPAPLTVTANPETRVYGAADPMFTATIAGFVNGQTLATSGVTGAPTLSSSDTASSPAGKYTISVGLGTLAAPDYTFKFVAGTLTVTMDGTTVQMQSSSSPVPVGQTVTLSATVAAATPTSGVPTGAVKFLDGTTVLGSGSLQNGVATLAVAFNVATVHTLTASYGGLTGAFTGTVSPVYQQLVAPAQAQTTTSLTLSSAATVYGQPLTLTATVVPANPPPPKSSDKLTGTVTFFDGGTSLGSAPLVGSTAKLVTNAANDLAVGTHTSVTATYGNDPVFDTSTSDAQEETVATAQTKIALTAPAIAVFGQTVTLTASVSAVAPSTAPPSGTVTFMDGTTSLGSVTFTGGIATLPVALAVSSQPHALTAAYADPAGNHKSSPSNTVKETVKLAGTKVTFTASAKPAVFGESVTLTASVTVLAPGAATPSGLVTFKDGTSTLGSPQQVTNGIATLVTSSLAVGTASLTASYGGDTDTAGSSATLSEPVNKVTTAVDLSASSNPVTAGQTVTLTAQVGVVAPGVAGPTGTVTFMDGKKQIGRGTLDNGVATLQTAELTAGTQLTAVYSGDADSLGNTSNTIAVVS